MERDLTTTEHCSLSTEIAGPHPSTLFLTYFHRPQPFNLLILSEIQKYPIVKSVNREAVFFGLFALKSGKNQRFAPFSSNSTLRRIVDRRGPLRRSIHRRAFVFPAWVGYHNSRSA